MTNANDRILKSDSKEIGIRPQIKFALGINLISPYSPFSFECNHPNKVSYLERQKREKERGRNSGRRFLLWEGVAD